MSDNTELQFWFLLQRSRVKADCEIFEAGDLPQEADIPDVPPLDQAIGYPEDPPEDRRLFRYNVPAVQREQDLSTLLREAWARVSVQYARCEVHTAGEVRYENHAETLLHSVALLVVSDELAAVKVTLPMRESASAAVVADCEYLPNFNEPYFSAALQSQPTQALQCYPYEPKPKARQSGTNLGKVNHWQLQFSGVESPCLVPLQDGEEANHPAFLVLGVAVGAFVQSPETLPLVRELLVFDTSSQGYSSLMFLFTPLLMQAWQYAHIDTASHRLDKQLRQHNQRYKQISDVELRTFSHEQLEHDLQAMRSLQAQAHYERGRIAQALRTLQINRNTLLERQRILTEALAETWQWDWHWQDEALVAVQRQRASSAASADARPALLQPFSYAMEDLDNKQTYLQGKLTHLQGSSERWQVALEQQRFELHEKMGHIGHAIIFLVALAEMGHVIHNATADKAAHAESAHAAGASGWQVFLDTLHSADSSQLMHILATLLQSPTLFVLLVMVIVFPVLRAWLRHRLRRRKARRTHRMAQAGKNAP